MSTFAEMKVVILAGGLGTRLAEETDLKPKPMVEVGGKPLLWHIMQSYSYFGFRQFVICLGYKGYVIKEYFRNYYLHTADVTFELGANSFEVHRADVEDWVVTLAETGEGTMTGGRIRRVANYLGANDFCLTYGDGLSDVDLAELVRFHHAHGRQATVTAVRPQARFGGLEIVGDRVESFAEKPLEEGGWINGGFFVLSPKVLERIDGDDTIWERGPLESLARDGELMARRHEGFWAAVDSLRDKRNLEQLWSETRAPWKR